MLNKVILQGRLVADPELRRTQSGTAVVSFRIAVDRNYKSKDANAQTADFINIVAWRQTAEFISRYFTKGSMILIEGSIQTREYTDNDNKRRYVTEVNAENVNFCGPKNSGTGSDNNGGYAAHDEAPARGSGRRSAAPAQTQSPANEFEELEDDDGELPF